MHSCTFVYWFGPVSLDEQTGLLKRRKLYNMKNWQHISSAPDGVEVWTKIHDFRGERNIQKMKRQGNLWFSGGMYVYYSPTHWSY